jgi:DNA mismatch repair protein MutS
MLTQPDDKRPAPKTRSSETADPARVTPMMAQYVEIKAVNPDCLLFYRMGDFYELFFDDAEIASRALGIVLTKRGKHQGADIPMCGVPIDRADDYLQRLIGLGHRVAVCEQTEDPAEARKRGAKSVVRREVVRLVTPGTITEERLLEPGRANILLALARTPADEDGYSYGLAALDISTGAFMVCETNEAGLAAEIARIEPSEIVAPDSFDESKALRRLLDESRAPTTFTARAGSDVTSERRLMDYYGVRTLDGFGTLTRPEIAAAAAAIAYVERTQLSARPPLGLPTRLHKGATMEIDAATRANLELTRTMAGAREGSLLACVDLTVTPAGGRLLAERIGAPLTDVSSIKSRLDAVQHFVEAPALRADVRASLKSAPDMARALSRLTLGRGGPRDLAALRDGLIACAKTAQRLRAEADAPQDLAGALAFLDALDADLHTRMGAALAQELPLNKRDGGFVRAEYLPELDEARALRDASRRVIASLQADYCEAAQTKQLKIKHNNFLGYYIETNQTNGERLLAPPFNAQFIHRQTMADAMRFSTTQLVELEAKIASAADRALAMELGVFDELCALAQTQSETIKTAAAALAAIDAASALAELAVQRDWTRPIVDDSLAFKIEGGRHPVVEAALKRSGEGFVANECDLSGVDAGALAIVTGPNMAGKSTYLRQNALIAALAQAGSFTPARRAHIGIVDRLFSRVGAADDLARGRSTFMVEMVETAAILNQAGPRSLVILDEIGRGTATFDGLSIAWAAVERLHEHNRARTLFATHFHELTHLTAKLPRLINLTMRVTDWNGDVVFLHEVARGAADRSYGIQVARLAGLPKAVVERAQIILAKLEAGDTRQPVGSLIDDLPLFAAAQAPAPKPEARDELGDALAAINPDDLTPRAALDALYALKRLAQAKTIRKP